MKPIVDKDKLNNLTNEIWKSAERLRGKFKAYEDQAVILPIIVIRRLECPYPVAGKPGSRAQHQTAWLER